VTGVAYPSLDLRSEYASRDTYRVLAELRDYAPIFYSDAHRAWLVTSHKEVSAAYTAKQLSSDRINRLIGDGSESAALPVLQMMKDWMVVSDPPSHTRLRKLAAAAFKRQQIAIMGEHIEARVDVLLDDFIASGETDLIEHFTHPLPGSIIAELLGAPQQDRDRFRDWSDELALVAFGAGGDAQDDRHERALAGLEEMFAYFRGLVEQLRGSDGDSIISVLLQPSATGELLDDDEILSMCALLLFAGHETTINSIANGTLALLNHPEQLAALKADPGLIPTAIEELLRFDGPIKTLIRYVKEDFELAGQPVKTGERVYLINASANHDPAVFSDPDALDITRSPNPHVAFGRGIHACIGAQLARLEMRISIEKIIERLPGLRLAPQEIHWHESLAARAMDTLHVEHDAAAG
jgi:cytochrome P450